MLTNVKFYNVFHQKMLAKSHNWKNCLVFLVFFNSNFIHFNVKIVCVLIFFAVCIENLFFNLFLSHFI